MRRSQRLCGTNDSLLEQGKRRTSTCTRNNAVSLQQDETGSYQVSNWRQSHVGCPTPETSSTLIQAIRKVPRTIRDLKQRRSFRISLETSQVLDCPSCFQ